MEKELRVCVGSFAPFWARYLRWGAARYRRSEHGSRATADNPSHRDGLGYNTTTMGTFDAAGFCVYLGITSEEYEYVRKSCSGLPVSSQTLSFELIDRIMTAMGEPERTHELAYTVSRPGGMKNARVLSERGLRLYLAGLTDGPGGHGT